MKNRDLDKLLGEIETFSRKLIQEKRQMMQQSDKKQSDEQAEHVCQIIGFNVRGLALLKQYPIHATAISAAIALLNNIHRELMELD